MPKIFDDMRNDLTSITLSDLRESLARIDIGNMSEVDVETCAQLMAKLSKNKDLISNLVEKMGQKPDGIETFFANPQSYILDETENYYVRMNVWYPKQNFGSKSADAMVEDLYAYGLTHNHDFNFLTVGYLGPGYDTVLYRLDDRYLNSLPGEKVEFYDMRHVNLSQGVVIHFEPFTDVHTQYYPVSLSVSLNLMLKTKYSDLPQLLFDGDIVRDYPSLGRLGRLCTFFDFGRYFQSKEVLEAISLNLDHNNLYVRDRAARAISLMKAELREVE